jgi:two-component system, NtrC family, response regulator AtoC
MEAPQYSLLILDEQANTSLPTSPLLSAIRCSSLASLPALLEEHTFDCSAYVMGEGDETFHSERVEALSGLPLILIGPGEGVEDAMNALSLGGTEYLSLADAQSSQCLLIAVRNACAKLRSRRAPSRRGSSRLIISSPVMREILATIDRLSEFSTTVVITGESGTGKELVAREIHASSPRRLKPFVAINCGAIPESLIESELFGHKKGAFTDASRDKKGLFEEADGGTIFLDEVGELPLHLQVKLLRTLQEQQIRRVGDEQVISIDVRVIAATLRDLEADVREGRFRDDLYYRLNVVSLHIPPLRERREEIPALVTHFMKKHNRRLGLAVRRINPDALDVLQRYRWRGNVRELENCVERAMVLTETDAIDIESLPDHVKEPSVEDVPPPVMLADDELSIKQKTRELEINLISRALRKTNGNRTRAAKILEISHRALLYKLKEYDLDL